MSSWALVDRDQPGQTMLGLHLRLLPPAVTVLFCAVHALCCPLCLRLTMRTPRTLSACGLRMIRDVHWLHNCFVNYHIA